MPVLRPLARVWTALLALAALALVSGLIARLLLPVAPLSPAPALDSSSPVDGAVDVLPRSPVVLRFSAPMNRDATLAAITIDPPTAGSFRWSDDATQISFVPETTLDSATDYTLTVDAAALGRWWRPIVAPRQIRFRTASLPAVTSALPSTAGTPLDGSLAIIFSQAMVPPAMLDRQASLPQLQIDPPTSVQLRWIDQMTLLIRPEAPLRAATRYTATIAPDLTDLRGVDLVRPFSWSWSTAWPDLLDRAPADGARWVSPRQPLTLTLAAPLDEALLRSALTFDPPVEGEVSAATLGATQLVTFTPRLGWQHGQSYQVRLRSPDPTLAPPPDLDWRFRVEPEPGLIAFLPGQGQTLAAGQDVRLVFSTPMDATSLRSGLSIDPPVGDLGLAVSETEVRLRPDLQPSSTYTLTVAADTPDRSGEPLGVTVTVPLRAAPADPALRVPAAIANVVSLPVSQTARLELERINLARIDLSLYKLDMPTVVRAMGLAPGEWQSFDPERYGQALTRRWQIDLSDPADTLVRDPIPLALDDDAPLPAGLYYLRLVAQEGPRADVLLQVSAIDLTLRQSDSQVLVWATDRGSGEPVADVPLLLYAGEALITRGRTGPDGVWEQPVQRPATLPRYLALADGDSPALVRGDWLAAPPVDVAPRYSLLPFLDQLFYDPGDSVQLGGIVRMRAADGGLALPVAAAPCRMQLTADLLGPPLSSAACAVSATGQLSGTLRLASHQPPGDYRLRVSVGDSAADLVMHVANQAAPAALLFDEAGGQIELQALRDGRPAAGATLSWTLRMEPLVAPADPGGFRFTPALAAPPPLSGTGTTDVEGRLSVPLPPGEAVTLRYWLQAELRDEDGRLAVAQRAGLIRPGAELVGLRLPSQVLTSDERALVEILALAPDGSPAAGRQIGVSVYRSDSLGGAPRLARRAVSDSQGRADVQLVQLSPGAYTIVADLGDSSSSVELWVAGGRYAGWQSPPGQVTVVADRDSYQPGDVARLLVTSPYARAKLLLTVAQGDLLGAEVRDLAASQMITLTITPEMAPAASLGVVLASGGERLVGDTAIRVAAGSAPLEVTAATDSAQYDPAGTAVLSVTTSIAGAPAPADLLVTVAPADALDDDLLLARFRDLPPSALAPALLRPGLPSDDRTPAEIRALPGAAGYLVSSGAGAGGAGQMVLRVPLPATSGRWRLGVYAAADAGRLAFASTTVTTSVPLELSAQTPPALRPGDLAQVSLQVRNTSGVTRSLQVRLQVAGGEIAAGAAAERQLLLAPNGSQRISWAVGPRPGARAVSLRYTLDGGDISQQVARELPVEALPPVAAAQATVLGSGSLTMTLPLGAPLAGPVELAVAPSVWATLVESADALAALPERSVEQRAGLLLISAALSRGRPSDGEDWAARTRQAADELAVAQNADGGWGWWPGTPSRPFVSAFALEAQVFAHEAVDGVPAPDPSAPGYLARVGASLGPDGQAYLLYVRARAGEDTSSAAAALDPDTLGPDGLAYLAQTLPLSAATSVIDRILATARRAPQSGASSPVVGWPVGSALDIPASPADVAAAAVQALRAVRPLAAERAAAERGLIESWGVDGWPNAFTAARVAVALRSQTPASGGPRALQLGAATLLDRADPLTATLRLQAPVAALAGSPTLQVTADDSARYMVAARAAGQQPPDGAAPKGISLYQEYVDPLSGAPIDPAALQVGQRVLMRVTLISARPILRGDLAVALPSALRLLQLSPHPPFIHVDARDEAGHNLRVAVADLEPGVYTLRVLLQVESAGVYYAPGARLHLDRLGLPPALAPDGPPLTVGRTL